MKFAERLENQDVDVGFFEVDEIRQVKDLNQDIVPGFDLWLYIAQKSIDIVRRAKRSGAGDSGIVHKLNHQDAMTRLDAMAGQDPSGGSERHLECR